MQLGLPATRRRTQLSLGATLFTTIALAWAPLSGFAQTSSTARTTIVTGSVLGAVTGQAAGPALVKLGQRLVLSNSEGHFSFRRIDQSTTTASAMKPFTMQAGEKATLGLEMVTGAEIKP